MRPIVWSEKGSDGHTLSVVVQMQFASVQRPMLTESQPQILLPLQAQQLGRSYNGRVLMNVEIIVRETCRGPEDSAPQQVRVHHADIHDL